MLTESKAIGEVVAAIAIPRQNKPVSLPVPRPRYIGRRSKLMFRPFLGASVGFVSTFLQPSIYQILVDRGWRRYKILIFPVFGSLESLRLMLGDRLLGLARIITSLTTGTRAVHITLSGILSFILSRKIYLSVI